MMKKRMSCLLLALVLALFAVGCGAQKTETKADGDEKTLTGTLDEVKDFMFVVTDDNGDSYALAFGEGEKPEGLDELEVSSRVTVTYTGELSVVDPFEGTIVSVEAAE